MEDSGITELYWHRNPAAITQSIKKYGAYCFAIANNILSDSADAEECVNDTWLSAWNSIPPERPVKLRMYLARLTRNLAINRYNAKNADKRGGNETALVLDELAECLAGGSDTEAVFEQWELERTIGQFVRALPEREGNVFARRYFFTEPASVIAEKYGLTENNVNVILSRVRKKLKAELIKEGYLHE